MSRMDKITTQTVVEMEALEKAYPENPETEGIEEKNKLIERFAEVQGIKYEEAEQRIGGGTDEEILKKIQDFTVQQINANSQIYLNRAQRRALQKKYGKSVQIHVADAEQQNVINETAKKLNYIDLIQKLRTLNEQKQKELEKYGEIIDEAD